MRAHPAAAQVSAPHALFVSGDVDGELLLWRTTHSARSQAAPPAADGSARANARGACQHHVSARVPGARHVSPAETKTRAQRNPARSVSFFSWTP